MTIPPDSAGRNDTGRIPDFTGWTVDRLIAQMKHLESILAVSAGQRDPQRPQLRAEYKAICAEIRRRATPGTSPTETEEE